MSSPAAVMATSLSNRAVTAKQPSGRATTRAGQKACDLRRPMARAMVATTCLQRDSIGAGLTHPRPLGLWQSRSRNSSGSLVLRGIPITVDQDQAPLKPAGIRLESPDGGAPVVLFGAAHCELQPEIAEFILKNRPKRVVVETAVTPEMGAETGSEMRAGDRIMGGQQYAFFVQMWYQIADELRKFEDPLSSPVWESVKMQFNGEHLAYIAAFAVEATLVFGDRPKSVTYQRLLNIPTVNDLDEAFAEQSAANYREIINGRPDEDVYPGTVNQVLMFEREAVMCSSLHKASHQTSPEGCVVGVVGASHLTGLQSFWEDWNWQAKALEAMKETGPSSKDMFMDAETRGVKRALLESVVRLHCRAEVLADLSQVLGPVEEAQFEAYSFTHEMYGTPRMLMAVLSKELLAEACQGRDCDMWELLEPLRKLRPVNGGPGYNQDEIMKLRTLHFQMN